MEIKLEKSRFVKIPEMFFEGDKLELKFKSSLYTLSKLYAVATNGSTTKRGELKDNTLDISDLCRKACVVDINVYLISRSKTVKEWRLEPLVVRGLNDVFKPIPETVHMREELTTMKKALKEMNTKINDTL